MLTRQHYKAIAEMIRKQYKNESTSVAVYARPAVIEIARELADYFASDNPLFDRNKFMAACGIDD